MSTLGVHYCTIDIRIDPQSPRCSHHSAGFAGEPRKQEINRGQVHMVDYEKCHVEFLGPRISFHFGEFIGMNHFSHPVLEECNFFWTLMSILSQMWVVYAPSVPSLISMILDGHSQFDSVETVVH
jgi:hypothetical protein